MSNVKISELPASEGLFDGCCFPVVTNGETYKVTYGQIKAKLQEELIEDDPTVPEHVKNITQTMINAWNAIVGSTHTHNNKNVLDGITAELLNKIDSAAQKASGSLAYTIGRDANGFYVEY